MITSTRPQAKHPLRLAIFTTAIVLSAALSLAGCGSSGSGGTANNPPVTTSSGAASATPAGNGGTSSSADNGGAAGQAGRTLSYSGVENGTISFVSIRCSPSLYVSGYFDLQGQKSADDAGGLDLHVTAGDGADQNGDNVSSRKYGTIYVTIGSTVYAMLWGLPNIELSAGNNISLDNLTLKSIADSTKTITLTGTLHCDTMS